MLSEARKKELKSKVIAAWKDIKSGKLDLFDNRCAYCMTFLEEDGVNCGRCPIYDKTNLWHCHGTPYWKYKDFIVDEKIKGMLDAEEYEARRQELAQAEIDFLEGV